MVTFDVPAVYKTILYLKAHPVCMPYERNQCLYKQLNAVFHRFITIVLVNYAKHRLGISMLLCVVIIA